MSSKANLPGRNEKASHTVSGRGERLQFGVRSWQAGLILGMPDATGTVLRKETGVKPAACQRLSDKTAEFGAFWRKVVNNLHGCYQICYLLLAVWVLISQGRCVNMLSVCWDCAAKRHDKNTKTSRTSKQPIFLYIFMCCISEGSRVIALHASV